MNRTQLVPSSFFNTMSRDFVGFDQLFDLMSRAGETGLNAPGYPPYNVEKVSENFYRIVLAVAGFTKDDLEITLERNELSIVGKESQTVEDEGRYLYKGIGKRRFKREFRLGEHFEISKASLQDGLLNIDLIREVPEAMKPKRIEIL